MTRINGVKFFASSSISLLAAVAWIQCGGGNSAPSSGNSAAPDSGPTTTTAQDSGSPTAETGPQDSGGGVDTSTGPVACATVPSTSGTLYSGVTTAPNCPGTITGPASGGYPFKYADSLEDGGVAMAATESADMTDGGDFQCAIHLTGSGYIEYAGAGFNVAGGSTAQCFDASQFSGIQLMARGTTTGTRTGTSSTLALTPNSFRIKLITQWAPSGLPDGDDYGGYCLLNADGSWTTCQVTWATAARIGFSSGPSDGGADAVDPTQLLKVQFELDSFQPADASAGDPMTFDVWFTDITFIPKM